MPVSNAGYIVLYQVGSDAVRIVRIRHQREDEFPSSQGAGRAASGY